jgi:hypothetical protein
MVTSFRSQERPDFTWHTGGAEDRGAAEDFPKALYLAHDSVFESDHAEADQQPTYIADLHSDNNTVMASRIRPGHQQYASSFSATPRFSATLRQKITH